VTMVAKECVLPPPFNLSLFDGKFPIVDRPHLLAAVQTKYEDYLNATPIGVRKFLVVYGAKGLGKSAILFEWMQQQTIVISVQCSRNLDEESVWKAVGKALGDCSAEKAERYVQENHPILHLSLGSERKTEARSGKSFINIGRTYSKHAFVILDLSPHTIDVTTLWGDAGRYSSIIFPEFTLDEAYDYLFKSVREFGHLTWLQQNWTSISNEVLNKTIHRVVKELVKSEFYKF